MKALSGAHPVKAYQMRVKGRVQRVGFRRYVLDLAQELGLEGSVENLPDGAVRVVVQGGEPLLSRFVEMVREAPLPAVVREVELEEVPVNPEIRGFRIIYGELGDELQEGFGGMQTIFMEYWKEFRDYRSEFRSFVDEFRDYREEFRREFGDYRNEFRDYRSEFRSFVDEFRDYREEFRSFAYRTDENFKLILEKYGEISSKLTVILETFSKEMGETRRMLNETMKALKEALEKLKQQ